MSAIPPNPLGSIIQTQGSQTHAAEQKRQESVSQADRVGGTFAERLQDVIENTDRDSQVYADAEGTGSQGRPFEEAPGDENEQPAEPSEEEPPGGLDVQA
jgi:hypothetical protein